MKSGDVIKKLEAESPPNGSIPENNPVIIACLLALFTFSCRFDAFRKIRTRVVAAMQFLQMLHFELGIKPGR